MEFCKAYNAATEPMRGNVIPVEITIFEDRSFTFVTKTPPAAELIKKAAGSTRARRCRRRTRSAGSPATRSARSPRPSMPDLNANDIDAAMKIVEGTARSMGVTVDATEHTPTTAAPHDPATRGRAAARPTTTPW